MRATPISSGIAVILAATLAGVAWGQATQGQAPVERASKGRLALGGRTAGLYPGGQVGLRVRVRNGTDRTVKVRSVRVVRKKGSAGCSPRLLTVSKRRRAFRLRSHRKRWVKLRVKLSPAAPDACQGTRFKVRFRARARAGR